MVEYNHISMSVTDTSEEPLIIEGVNISEYDEDDLVGAEEIEEMIDS